MIKAVQVSKGNPEELKDVQFDPATVRRDGKAVDYVSLEHRAVAIYTLPDAQGALEPEERLKRLVAYGADFTVAGVNERGDLVDLGPQAEVWLENSLLELAEQVAPEREEEEDA